MRMGNFNYKTASVCLKGGLNNINNVIIHLKLHFKKLFVFVNGGGKDEFNCNIENLRNCGVIFLISS